MNQNDNLKQCPHCASFIRRMATACEVCKQSLDPEISPDISRLSNCPVCKIPIYPAHLAKHNVLHCEECEGTVVPKEVLMKLQAGDAKTLERSPLARNHIKPPYFETRDKPPFLICPFCMKKMQETRIGNISVDICEKCSALFMERGKEKHVNELLGPYKSKMLNKSDGGSGSSRTRRRR